MLHAAHYPSNDGIDKTSVSSPQTRKIILPEAAIAHVEPPALIRGGGNQVDHIARVGVEKFAPEDTIDDTFWHLSLYKIHSISPSFSPLPPLDQINWRVRGL